MSLSPEIEATFTTIIDAILASSDLNTISVTRIRQGLQASVQYDITPQKKAIKALIRARFDIMSEKVAAQTNGHTATTRDASPAPLHSAEKPSTPPVKGESQHEGEVEDGDQAEKPSTPPVKVESQHEGEVEDGDQDEELSELKDSPAPEEKPVAKKHKQEDDDDDLSDPQDSPAPKKKKPKVEYDSDAAFAAKLQAQENGRIRSTRGGGPKKAVSAKKKSPKKKKKTSAKVKAEDDSDLDGSGSDVKERKVNRSGGFHKELLLSPPLSALLDNEIKLSRPQTVKRIWAYVRAHDLQDPNDKRIILCDEGMRAVFKQDKVHMFTMNKILNQNLYNTDE